MVCGGSLHGLWRKFVCSAAASPYYLLCPPNYLPGIAKVPVYACRVNDCCGLKAIMGLNRQWVQRKSEEV